MKIGREATQLLCTLNVSTSGIAQSLCITLRRLDLTFMAASTSVDLQTKSALHSPNLGLKDLVWLGESQCEGSPEKRKVLRALQLGSQLLGDPGSSRRRLGRAECTLKLTVKSEVFRVRWPWSPMEIPIGKELSPISPKLADRTSYISFWSWCSLLCKSFEKANHCHSIPYSYPLEPQFLFYY